MDLFLQGERRIGKSTLLRNALMQYENAVSGFMTQRLLENGAVCGYRACVVDGTLPAVEAPFSQNLSGVFLLNGKTFPGVLETAISQARVACVNPSCRIILLDEIGGIELLSEAFMEPLYAILQLNKPRLGVIKARGNLAHTAATVGLPEHILLDSDRLHRTIAAQGRILTLTPKNQDATSRAICDFLATALPANC